VILREMPPLADESFRTWFYTRWGRENCLIAARTKQAEYPLYQQRLSIKAAWGGREDYFVDGRRLAIDDDTFMVLNDGRTYASRLRSRTPVTSFSIFFRPGLVEDVERTLRSSPQSLLDNPHATQNRCVEFAEHVRYHDRQISPILRFIYRHVEMGITDENWYEEQLQFLASRMLALRESDGRAVSMISAIRPGTRKELFRRAGLAADFINTHFADPICLQQIATASLLAPYHCLRIFKSVYGKTPIRYLNDRRVQAAVRILHDSKTAVDDVAALVGFQSRTTLYRHLKRKSGASAISFRPAVAGCPAT
jgi:AraC family transcriptional regulator